MTRLVLLGAGHVHVALLAHADRLRRAGIDITLVDTGSFVSGIDSPGYLLDSASVVSSRWPLRRLCSEYGVAHRDDRAIGLDTRHRRLWLAGGQRLDYDLLSFNVGQEMDTSGLDAGSNGMQLWRSNSVREMVQFGQALAATESSASRPLRIAVRGATHEAAQIVAALSASDGGAQRMISWYLPSLELLPTAPAGASRRLGRVLSRRGVHILFSTPVAALDDRHIVSRDGRRFPTDHVVVADRPLAQRVIHAGPLPATDAGLYVTRRLQSPADTRVFAVGSCAQLIGGGGLPTHDVAGQVAVLSHNLLAVVGRRPMRGYKPVQRKPVVDLRDGSAIDWLGHVWWHNRLAARLERRRTTRLGRLLLGRA